MSNVALIKNSFNAGELSPLLDGRSDIDKYANGCSILENFIPLVQGGITKRPGTQFINNAANSRPWLLKFEFSLQQSFILEFGNNYIRFYYNYGLVTNTDSTPYELQTPYTNTILTNEQGTFALSTKQSGDVIYIVVDGVPPQKLERIANNNWTLVPLELKNGPFQDQNTDQNKTISITIAGPSPYHPPGDVSTATANFNAFTADMVGTTFSIEPSDTISIKQWQQLTSYPDDPQVKPTVVTNDGKYYLLTGTPGTSGYIAPIHIKGTQSDGVLDWYYIGQNTTYFKILSYISPTQVTVTSTDNYTSDLYIATPYWSLYAWYASVGYPTQVELFRSRLLFSRSQNIWFSKSGDFENFEAKDYGNIIDSSAITIKTNSDGTTQIQNLTSTNMGLICSTDLDQIIVDNATPNLPFSPTNIQVNPGSGIGSRKLDLLRINNDLLFVTTSGNRICNMQYDSNTMSFTSPDISVMSEHILKPYIIDIAYQQNPNNIIWMVRSDGILIGLTYNKDQNVYSFHRHIFDGKVLSIEVIPNPNQLQDDLWIAVQRSINGSMVTYIEVLKPSYDIFYPTTQQWYLDCALAYSGTPIQNITGLNHLIGKTVSAFGDNIYQGDYIVSANGDITINFPASNIVIGLPYIATMQTMKLEAPSQSGTSQGAEKRIHRTILRLNNTMGKALVSDSYLGNDGNYDEIYFHEMNGLLNIPAEPFTGDKKVNLTANYNDSGKFALLHSEPYACTLLCIILNVGIYS